MNNIIEDMATQPLMVAFSGLVNDEVRKDAKEAGFDLVIESPLSVQKVNEVILLNLELRNKKII